MITYTGRGLVVVDSLDEVKELASIIRRFGAAPLWHRPIRGGASGDTIFALDADGVHPPSSSFATPDTRGLGSSPVRDFDAAADEECYATIVTPRHYSGATGVTVTLGTMASTATSGDAVWGVAGVVLNDDADDIDTVSVGTETTGTITAPSVSGEVTYDDYAITAANLGTPVVKEAVIYRIRRIGTNGSDTMAGDGELLTVEGRDT